MDIEIRDSINKDDTKGLLLIESYSPLKIEINQRGSSSIAYPKKSYSLSIKDTQISLLGLPCSNKWVLYSPYSDKTYLRNKLGYSLYSQMGDISCSSAFTELFINKKFMGLYEVVEKQQSPVIKKFDSSIYLIKVDKTSGKLNYQWASNYSKDLNFEFHYPRIKKLTTNDKEFVSKRLDELEKTILASPDKLNLIADENSFIDYFIIQELCKNPDGYRSSVYFFITSDGMIHMGPLWDCNFAFGNSNQYNSYKTEGWRFDEQFDNPASMNKIPDWWKCLYRNHKSNTKIRSRWSALRSSIINPIQINNWIDSMTNLINPAVKRDQLKWKTFGKLIKWNYYAGRDFIQEINYLKSWIKNRIYWIDKQLGYTSLAQE